jgi:putative nucleotidyltransferase with HDIG domain
MQNRTATRDKLLSFTTNIPPLPNAVQRVMTMLRDPRIQLTKVGEVVALDQGFAGKVLRMANSAYFGLPRRVCNVTEALVLLGFANVRNVLISASVGNILSGGLVSYGLRAGSLWEHSVGTAYVCQILSRKADTRVYSMAFSTGLLHDVGKVAIDRALGDEGRHCLRALIGSNGQAFAEIETVGTTHAAIGGEICRKWGLPEKIVDAVAKHDKPDSCSESGLASIVAAADHCTKLLLAGRDLLEEGFAAAPRGTYVPEHRMLEKLTEELPSIISSARELLQGFSEVNEDEVPGRKK